MNDALHYKSDRSFESCLEAFEEAWQTEHPPVLSEFLQSVPDTSRRELLIELIMIDLEWRWRRGGLQATVLDIEAAFPTQPKLEDYVQAHPKLGGVDALPLDLLVEEYRIRHRFGDRPEHVEYAQRFDVEEELLKGALSQVDAQMLASGERQLKPANAIHGSFAEIDLVCDEFAHRWQKGERPAREAFLQRVPAENRPTLLRNLLSIELQNRRAVGDEPDLGVVVAEHPEHEDLVRQVFADSTFSGITVHQDTNSLGGERREVPAAGRLGHYKLKRWLGGGGMGDVYEAEHVQNGNRVALKTLKKLTNEDGDALHLFNNEFRQLRDVNHPNLIGLQTLESDGKQRFITMDLIDGCDFTSYVRPNKQLNEVRLRDALSQLVTGVMVLHSQRVLHRDLKPSNVMVKRDGCVVVLDFGLVAEFADTLASLSRGGVGTPAYMAPEQMTGRHVTPAADWYAVGVMLYEALTGQLPFQSSNVWDLVRLKQQEAPPSLLDRQDLPQDLAALCMRLLERDPQDRPDPEQVGELLSGQSMPVRSAQEETHPLIHRESQLAALQSALEAVEARREPVTVFVSGKSGEGKSSLIQHFLEPIRKERRLTILSGRCYDRESVPFKALDSLIDALASYLKTIEEVTLALLIPKDISVLARVFPVLSRVDVIAKAAKTRTAVLDDQQIRARAFAALRELIGELSNLSPIILFIDDLQWGDSDSAEVMFELLRPAEAPQVLFLGSYRSDEASESLFLQEWESQQQRQGVELPHQNVTVGPLSTENCLQLMVTELGVDSDVIRKRAAEFAEETGGNPFLLLELISCFDPESETFRPIPMHEVIESRLVRLPEEAGRLLEVIAISGQSIPLGEAAEAAGIGPSAVSTVTHMRTENLVRMIGAEDDPRIDTYHDKIRETVLAQLDDAACRGLHQQLAKTIEARIGVDYDGLDTSLESDADEAHPPAAIARVYDLAYHYDAAGHEKALTYALVAAEQARRQSALEVAVEQYTIAKRNAQEADHAIRYRIAAGFGETLMLLGRYDQTNNELEVAVSLSDDPNRKAEVEAFAR